jgi:hypothetical protein
VLAFVDDGADGTGSRWPLLLAGRTNANNAARQDHSGQCRVDQLPEQVRGRVLVRADTAAGVRALLDHLSNLGPQNSVGARQPIVDALANLPRAA